MNGRHASGFGPMPKKTSKSKQSRINPADDVMTRDKLEPFFENIKELIVSTAKGTETVLGKRIDKVEKEIQFTQQALKATKDELKSDIAAVKGEMSEMKDELRTEIKATETRLSGRIDEVESGLRTEIKDTEMRLSDKIDGIHVRLDEHETRITTLEEAR